MVFFYSVQQVRLFINFSQLLAVTPLGIVTYQSINSTDHSSFPGTQYSLVGTGKRERPCFWGIDHRWPEHGFIKTDIILQIYPPKCDVPVFLTFQFITFITYWTGRSHSHSSGIISSVEISLKSQNISTR